MKKNKFALLVIILLSLLPIASSAQLFVEKTAFSHADTLRGSLSPLRNCYDINYYHLDVQFNLEKRFISGSNQFSFTAMQDFSKLQFDLFANLNIQKIIYHNDTLRYTREGNAVFVFFPETVKKNSKESFTVFYSGYPAVAKKAPMESGVVFATDSLGNPFVSTACESKGASIWWPNKDHLSDEVDSMLISVSVPNGLKDVSNGRLCKVTKLKNGYTKFDWFVSNPINNYNVAVNIGKYVHVTESYNGKKGKLTLDYWLLPYNRKKAELQFKKNVKSTIEIYEHWFGPYPFYKDGYKLVETPYPAMEHQSAISYGGYLKGGPSTDFTAIPGGEKWDFIIVHESAHEWFGNSLTAKDIAELWIHEAFATYALTLFVESKYNKQVGLQVIYDMHSGLANDRPITGPYNVNQMGSGDMYNKGAVLLNMIRTIVDDDDKWLSILNGVNATFYHQTVTGSQIVKFFSERANRDLAPIFDQYLNYSSIPVLEFTSKDNKLNCRWIASAKGFNMPVRIKIKGGEYKLIYPDASFKPLEIENATIENIIVDTANYYIGIMK